MSEEERPAGSGEGGAGRGEDVLDVGNRDPVDAAIDNAGRALAAGGAACAPVGLRSGANVTDARGVPATDSSSSVESRRFSAAFFACTTFAADICVPLCCVVVRCETPPRRCCAKVEEGGDVGTTWQRSCCAPSPPDAEKRRKERDV